MFKEVQTEKLSDIKSELISYFDLTDKIKRLPVHIDHHDLLEKSPQLKAFLTELDLIDKIRLVRTVTVMPKGFYSAHVDGSAQDSIPRTVALNIPMVNCDDSLTRFFERKGPGIKPLVKSNKKMDFSYQDYSYDDIVLKTQFTLRHPTFLKICEIHDVINNSSKVRYCLTIRFSPEPKIFEN